VLAIAERHHYPLVSSHTNTGGFWTDSDLRRLYELGGFATARPDNTAGLEATLARLGHYGKPRRYFGVGLGSDTGGFNSLPGPEPDARTAPLRYSFTPYLCHVRFKRQRSGERTYDLNSDGVAHYGLYPDLLARMQQRKGGKAALRLLFRSADAYVRTWSRAAGTFPAG